MQILPKKRYGLFPSSLTPQAAAPAPLPVASRNPGVIRGSLLKKFETEEPTPQPVAAVRTFQYKPLVTRPPAPEDKPAPEVRTPQTRAAVSRPIITPKSTVTSAADLVEEKKPTAASRSPARGPISFRTQAQPKVEPPQQPEPVSSVEPAQESQPAPAARAPMSRNFSRGAEASRFESFSDVSHSTSARRVSYGNSRQNTGERSAGSKFGFRSPGQDGSKAYGTRASKAFEQKPIEVPVPAPVVKPPATELSMPDVDFDSDFGYPDFSFEAPSFLQSDPVPAQPVCHPFFSC